MQFSVINNSNTTGIMSNQTCSPHAAHADDMQGYKIQTITSQEDFTMVLCLTHHKKHNLLPQHSSEHL